MKARREVHMPTECLSGADGSYRYAEMNKEEKNAISHRSKALQKLKSWLESNS
jgi:inosine/xanthosine triphosphate pyrophosphatase family protein